MAPELGSRTVGDIAALRCFVSAWGGCGSSAGRAGMLRIWKRRQDCSQKQLGGDLHAGTGTWESLLSVMMQVRLSVTTAVRPGARAHEVNARAYQEPSWAALFVGSWLMQ